MENKKVGKLLVRCKDSETGEEGYVPMLHIGLAVFQCLEEEGYLNKLRETSENIGKEK